jgi:hypothetical protein
MISCHFLVKEIITDKPINGQNSVSPVSESHRQQHQSNNTTQSSVGGFRSSCNTSDIRLRLEDLLEVV